MGVDFANLIYYDEQFPGHQRRIFECKIRHWLISKNFSPIICFLYQLQFDFFSQKKISTKSINCQKINPH